MDFVEDKISGVFLIDLNKIEDERGFFARTFCAHEYSRQNLNTNIVQVNNSFNKVKGTLRGIHFQKPPMSEVKIVRCIQGALFDVVVDLRYNSPTFLQWTGVELTADNRRILYIPEGVAHSFLTLKIDTEILYFVSNFYSQEHEGGILWNDPLLKINWPLNPKVISAKDIMHPTLDPDSFSGIWSVN